MCRSPEHNARERYRDTNNIRQNSVHDAAVVEADGDAAFVEADGDVSGRTEEQPGSGVCYWMTDILIVHIFNKFNIIYSRENCYKCQTCIYY
jgi:hypothetical protein